MMFSASAASILAETVLQFGVHDIADQSAVNIDAGVDAAAQIAVGENAEQDIVAIDNGRHRQTFRAHFQQRALSGVSGKTFGIAAPLRMMSSTFSSSLRPSRAARMRKRKILGVNPRASSSAIASASPMASAAAVLDVGARFSGQASSARRHRE